jgi:hypothetical protein
MTVKSLSEEAKTEIARRYTTGPYTVSELVYAYNRSRRTIIRVLEEQGFTHVTIPRKAKEAPLPAPVPVYEPEETQSPWWNRMNALVKNFANVLGRFA